MLRRTAMFVALLSLAGIGGAQAGEEKLCSDQYTLEEHAILEWAALGGDPHAQFAVAQCAAPEGVRKLDANQKVYALQWLTLATCDADGSATVAERDRITRRLKFSSDLSFRRFGGITEDEKWTARERQFVEFRREQVERLQARFEDVSAAASETERAAARDALADRFARMGGMGLLRLSEMTSCRNFGASPGYAAGAWAATDFAWNTDELTGVYGESMHDDWSISAESTSRFAALSQEEKRLAASVRENLLRTTPTALARLEDDAALGRVERLGIVHTGPGGSTTSGNTATLAAQYALEALGFMDFINGPDNDYGPTTIEAVKRAQAKYGMPETRWLSHRQLRSMVCDAATKQNDPVSYFHLALMYAEGWGFPKDIAKAKFAIDRAEGLMKDRLERSQRLAAWKLVEYPKFTPQIARAKASIEAEWSNAPAHLTAGDSKISARTLCD